MGINHSSLVEVYVHIVWSTWDRAPLLSPEVRPRVYLCIREEAARLKAEIIAMAGSRTTCTCCCGFPPP